MPQINAQRLLDDLRALRSFGASGSGVVRPAFSPEDTEARRWLASRYEEAGLATSIDGVGNVIGRSRNSGQALLLGSHSDTQPTGGWLDGALGVVYGLEAARALNEDKSTRRLAVDVVSWQDEEARFLACLGSRSFCGLLSDEAIGAAVDNDGVRLTEAIRTAGLSERPRAQIDRGRYVGFVEAHIEQGPTLEDASQKIGVVTSIVGLDSRVFRIRGQQNHAGTTMMSRRKDAATALYDLASTINRAFPRVAGERSVWTMGRATISPGAPSIVPGYAELYLQYRDVSLDILGAFNDTVDQVVSEVSRRNSATIEVEAARSPIEPSLMDDGLRKHLGAAAERNAPGKWTDMPSGAFHDAGYVSSVLPAAMLFVPSIGGVSHDFAEDSHEEDIVLGCQVLADAAESILVGTHT